MYEHLDLDIGSIQGFDNIKKFFIENKDIFMNKNKVITFDIETKFLNLKDNKLLGFGIGFSKTKSRYIITRNLSLKELKTIFNTWSTMQCFALAVNKFCVIPFF